ncbi:MAG: hypothetical protein LAQ30_30080 [Acidobacteriia bacterium]|nr:hypothetical protein [Terriglobia bacterium]
MKWNVITLTVWSATSLFAGQEMNVSVCNLDEVAESLVSNARRETEAVFRSAGPAALDLMGRAFPTEPSGAGSMADAYLQAVQDFAERHEPDDGALLGFVIAHELGHLLLGPGHARDGVMQSPWGRKEVEAARRRSLLFNKEEAARIRLELQTRTASADDPPGK